MEGVFYARRIWMLTAMALANVDIEVGIAAEREEALFETSHKVAAGAVENLDVLSMSVSDDERTLCLRACSSPE